MNHYVVNIELAERDVTAARAAVLLDALQHVSPAVDISARGWLRVSIALPGDTIAQACQLAIAQVEQAAGTAAVAVTVTTEREFDAREGWESTSDLVSVTEAAQLLSVSRQAVLDRIRRHTLPATKIGRDYAIPRSALGGSTD